MPLYRITYHDRTTRWLPNKHEAYASNEHELRARMKQLGRRVMSAKPIGDIRKTYYFHIQPAELLSYIDQLLLMISSGKSISDATQRIARQNGSRKFRFMAAMVADRMITTKVGHAFSTFPNIFPGHFTGMLAAGAEAGKLREVLTQIRIYLRDGQKLSTAVKRGTAYPKAVSLVMLCLVGGAFGLILPNFAKMFQEFRVPLPGVTRSLFATSMFVTGHYVMLIATAIVLAVTWRHVKKAKGTRLFFDNLWMKIPKLNTSIQYIACSRLSGTMGVLIASGLNAQDALASCEKVVGNSVFERGIRDALVYLSGGRMTLSESLAKTGLWPDPMIATVEIAQENGNLDEQFPKLHEYYSEEARSRIEQAIDMLNPVLVVLLVAFGGYIAAGLMLPLFDMSSAMSAPGR